MKKVVFFIPAIVFTVFYGLVVIGTGLSVSPMVLVGVALFILSGILLSKKLFWGGLFGIFPGGYLVYMSTINTGQIMNIELPLGVIVIAYFLICSSYVFIKYKKHTGKS